MRRMFADIDADIYLMADGDLTYAPGCAAMITLLLAQRSDMVVGTRRPGYHRRSGGHARQPPFNGLHKGLFGRDFTDIFSGYRVFSRRFVKSFPALSSSSRSRPS